MAHDKDNDNLKDFFSHDGDFDNLIDEKLKGFKGWQKDTEIIDSLKATPQISEKKAVEKAEKDASAEKDLNGSGNTTETQELKVQEKSLGAGNVNGPTDNPPKQVAALTPDDDKNRVDKVKLHELMAKQPLISEDAPTSKEVDEQRAIDENELSGAEAKLNSDPDYTRAVLEGKIERTVITGIQKGPWAKTEVHTEVVSGEIALRNIGQHKISEVWKRAANSAKALNRDVEKIRKHIQLLQLAASNIDFYKHTLIEELKAASRDGDANERAAADSELARIYREKDRRRTDDSSEKRPRKSNGEAKVEKLGTKEMEALDTFIMLCNRDYEQILGFVKAKGDVTKLEAKIAYIKKALGLA